MQHLMKKKDFALKIQTKVTLNKRKSKKICWRLTWELLVLLSWGRKKELWEEKEGSEEDRISIMSYRHVHAWRTSLSIKDWACFSCLLFALHAINEEGSLFAKLKCVFPFMTETGFAVQREGLCGLTETCIIFHTCTFFLIRENKEEYDKEQVKRKKSDKKIKPEATHLFFLL